MNANNICVDVFLRAHFLHPLLILWVNKSMKTLNTAVMLLHDLSSGNALFVCVLKASAQQYLLLLFMV